MGIQPFDNLALDAMRSSGYAFKDALCELIDNSLWHGNAKDVQIVCSWLNKESKTERMNLREVYVADNGNGMDSDTLALSVQIGKSTTYGSSDNFGRFGYGMIAGALTQCKLVEIYSKTENGKWNYIQYQVDKVSQGQLIEEPKEQNPPEKYTSVIKNKGTVVIWSIFDIAESFDQDWEAYNAKGSRKGDLGLLHYELGRIYRKFIGEEIVGTKDGKTAVLKNNNVRSISLNGEKINPVDPLYMTKIPGFENDPEPHYIYDELTLPIDTHISDKERTGKEQDEIHIRLTILNEQWRKLSENGTNPRQQELFPRFIQWNEGISVLRNGREVSFTDYPKVWQNRGTWDRFWGCEIEFPATLDKRFTIKNVKIGIKCDKDLHSQIKTALAGPINDANRVIRRLFKQTVAEAEKVALTGPHSAAEERFKKTDTGTRVLAEPITVEEKEKLQEQLAARFSSFDEKVDREKFGEIGVIFQDDTKMYENGPFLEVKNNLGNNIVIYNLQHPFFIHLDEVYATLESLSEIKTIEDLLGRKLTEEESKIRDEWKKQVANTRYIIDLLLGSFAAAKGDIDPESKQLASSTLNSLISRWTENLFTVTNDKDFSKRVEDEI
jgi:hypothetical protein